MAISNVILTEYTTLAYLHSPRTDTVTATTAKIYVQARVATGTTYWAVVEGTAMPSVAEIIAQTGFEDAGSAASVLTEATFDVTVTDTETVGYSVWFAHTDSIQALEGVRFGYWPAAGVSSISSPIGNVFGPAIGSAIAASTAAVTAMVVEVGPSFMFNLADNSQYVPFL